MIRLTAYVSGNIQRVGYRAKVISQALEMGLVGLVQNRPDGSVLVVAEGEKKDDLERFASAIRIENAFIHVEDVSAKYSQGTGQYSTFRKITGPEEVGERLDDGIEILKEMLASLNNLTAITKDIAATTKDTAITVKDLTILTKEGLAKQDQSLGKMDRMLDKQDQSLGKMDQMLDKQDQSLGKMDQMLDKQDQSLGKMDRMLDKQDQSLGKMDQTLDKQDGTIEAICDLKRNDERFVRMEKDIRTIKNRLGIR